MTKDVRERFWVAINGSIYCEDLEGMKVPFTGKTIMVRKSVAFNVGNLVANHIVKTHNAHVKWKRENPSQISIWVDTSDSISKDDMKKFLDELNGIK